jgi:hypothetical protein
MILPNIWKNKKCSKPPTSKIVRCFPLKKITFLMVDFLTGASPRRPSQVLFVPSPGGRLPASGLTIKHWEKPAGKDREFIGIMMNYVFSDGFTKGEITRKQGDFSCGLI